MLASAQVLPLPQRLDSGGSQKPCFQKTKKKSRMLTSPRERFLRKQTLRQEVAVLYLLSPSFVLSWSIGGTISESRLQRFPSVRIFGTLLDRIIKDSDTSAQFLLTKQTRRCY